MRNRRNPIAKHLQLLIDLAAGEQEEKQKKRIITRISAAEATKQGQQFPLVRTIRVLELDCREAWCLRFAVGRALAAGLELVPSRAFTPTDLASSIADHVGAPLVAFAGTLSDASPLVRNGIIVSEQVQDWSNWLSWQLAVGFERWFLGSCPKACAAAVPMSVPASTRALDPVQRAASRLGAYLDRNGVRTVVLVCDDVGFAASVACEASADRGRHLSCWQSHYPTSASVDVLPLLVWAASSNDRDVALSFDVIEASPFSAENGEVGFSLDLDQRRSGATLFLLQQPTDPDPLGLRMTLPVLNLEPLWRADGSIAVREALSAAIQRDLPPQRSDGSISSVGSLNAEIGIRALKMHSEVSGDLACKVIPDMVNRESRMAAAGREWESGSGGGGPPSPVPESTLDHMVLDDRTRNSLDKVVERARSGNRCVLLLHGPSGVGKSFLGRCLAGSLERPAVAVRSSEIRGKHYGEEERLLQQLFERAMARDEVLIFDEADEWVGRREGSSACEFGGRLIESSEMLLHLERFTGVAVLTTNRSEVLDPALQRRVDVWLSMPLPGPEERLALWARALDCKLMVSPSVLLTFASVPLAGGDIEACVVQVEASVGVLSANALMDAVKQRSEMRAWLG